MKFETVRIHFFFSVSVFGLLSSSNLALGTRLVIQKFCYHGNVT